MTKTKKTPAKKDKDAGDVPPDERWGKYKKPGSSIRPGGHPGTIAPTEDPRDDSGLHPKPKTKK